MIEVSSAAKRRDFEATALWLGYLGLAPFLFCTLLLLLGSMQSLATDALRFYAAVILSFIGAIHWGRSLGSGQTTALIISVTPSLYAWLCLLLPGAWSLPALAAGLIALNVYDQKIYRTELAWFARLRWRLTTEASLSLIASFAILFIG